MKLYIVAIFACCLFPIVGSAQEPIRPDPILLLYAFDEEGLAFGQQMQVVQTDTVLGRAVLVGTLAGNQTILAETGVGMTNAAMTTQSMIERYQPRLVLLSGIAGAVDTTVRVGDICVPERWVAHDYGYIGAEGFEAKGIWRIDPTRDSLVRSAAFLADTGLLGVAEDMPFEHLALDSIGGRRPGIILGGTGVSGNQFIDSYEKRVWLSEQFRAHVTDMESAAVAQVCAVNGLPFVIFRSASDLAGGSGSSTARKEMDQFFKVAAKNSAAVVIGFLGSLSAAQHPLR